MLFKKLIEWLLKHDNEIVCLHPEEKIAREKYLKSQGYVIVKEEQSDFRTIERLCKEEISFEYKGEEVFVTGYQENPYMVFLSNSSVMVSLEEFLENYGK